MRKALAMAVIMLFVGATTAMAQVSGTAHNMNTYITAEGGTPETNEVCIYCHAPHNRADYALWNRTNNAGGDYTPYTSPTIDMTIGNPGDASLGCLSCHDGTLGVEAFTGFTLGTGPYNITGAANVGQNLTDDHPVGVTYDPGQDADFDLAVNLAIAQLYGPSGDQVECASCHDPHDNTFGSFLVASNANSAICVDCHLK